jgi:hypothetical protein
MKKLISYTMIALFAATGLSIAAPDKAAFEAKENTVWQAFKDKKADEFKKHVSPDMMAVSTDGMYDMQKELDAMAKQEMKSFTLSDFTVVMTDRDTALVTYKAKVESSIEGKDMSGDYNCGTVWQMKNGAWHAVFHSDMKAEAPAK